MLPHAPTPIPAPLRLRTLIAEDSAPFRSALAALLSVCPEIEIVGAACNGLEAVELADQCLPSLVIMDIHMPKMSGLTATRRIHEKRPEVRIVLISLFVESALREACTELGAAALIEKNAHFRAELLLEIRRAVEAQTALRDVAA